MPVELGQAVLLGVVQGFSEFLPISSAGHLILVPMVLGWNESPLTRLEFTVALHSGTLLALLGVFWRDWVRLAIAAGTSLFHRSLAQPDARLAWLIGLATVPGAVAGLLVEPFVESALRSPTVVGAMMVGIGIVLGVADRWSRKSMDERSVGVRGALAIGLGQALALVPGVSRSGITIAVGLGLGLTRAAAARFSFLLSAPIIAGAAAKEAVDLVRGGLAESEIAAYVVGIAAAAAAGYIAIRWLLAYLARGSLLPFVAYRVAVGLTVLVLASAGWIS